jgi:ribosomal protein S12 methylthiotransferase accessory factor
MMTSVIERVDTAEAAPIVMRGQTYRAPKTYWHGTQRSVMPAETLERIRPLFRQIGLTRLADITGLDRIGIPVVLSVRPNAGYLALDAGKGFTLTAATVSAAMECLERHHAEMAAVPELLCSYEELDRAHRVVPIVHLPLTKHSLFSSRRPERWALGWDLMQEAEVAVPAAMVPMERFKYGRGDLVSFQTGSNGLASGNHFLEALESGLLEVIERDAVACHSVARQDDGGHLPRVRLESISSPLVRELLERFDTAGIAPILFDCRVDTVVPVFMACIYDLRLRNIGLFKGYGAHLDPEIAMVRALTEAVQGRLVYIAGSRDDMFRRQFLRLKQADHGGAIAELEQIPATVDASELPSEATATFEGDVGLLLQKLRAVGLQNAVVFDLSQPDEPVAVVRVVAPGLEGYLFDYYAPGPRARAFAEGRQA